MAISIYKFKGKKEHFPNLPGFGFLLFVDGILNAVHWDFKRPLTDGETFFFRRCFPFRESDLVSFRIYADFSLIKARSASDKIKLFGLFFKAKKGFSYQAKQAEKANIKNVSLNQELLEVYFSNEGFPLSVSKSISDYIKHYNFIRDIARNGSNKKSKFPDEYDPAFARKLEPSEAQKYHQHLHRLGWTRDRVRGVWHEPEK